MSLKQIRKRMYDTRNSKLRIQLMYLVRGLHWRDKEKSHTANVTHK